MIARGLLVAFVAALALAVWYASGRAASDQVDAMSQPVLEAESRRMATSGGVTGFCWRDCATGYMRRLAFELVERAFGPSHEQWALCVVGRESGFNPGAVSPTGDWGLAQFHYPLWKVDYQRLRRDPPYAVRAFVKASRGGRHRSPWGGGAYVC